MVSTYPSEVLPTHRLGWVACDTETSLPGSTQMTEPEWRWSQ